MINKIVPKITYGEAEAISPIVKRVIAKNPGVFTYTGTGTYIIGDRELAIIDPGPKDNRHLKAILEASKGSTITHILITHTHLDHSPLAKDLQEITNAKTYGYGPHIEWNKVESVKNYSYYNSGDKEFTPDIFVKNGDSIKSDEWEFECVFTPGHIGNHMCYSFIPNKYLFVGDHIMSWSSTVIAPPDGNMGDYIASLRMLLDRNDYVYLPTHGDLIYNPKKRVAAIIEHRIMRETQIINCLKNNINVINKIVDVLYKDINDDLYEAAKLSILAHLEDLIRRKLVIFVSRENIETKYYLS